MLEASYAKIGVTTIKTMNTQRLSQMPDFLKKMLAPCSDPKQIKKGYTE